MDVTSLVAGLDFVITKSRFRQSVKVFFRINYTELIYAPNATRFLFTHYNLLLKKEVVKDR